MSRYRKIEIRMWGDAGFRSLSGIPACGQGLWLFLLTGPHTGPIPGVFRAGRASMSEELGWSLEAFDEAFREVLAQGMVEADLDSRFIFIPKAIFHNKPESPNVVKSWGAEWNLLPECPLKSKVWSHLKTYLDSLGCSFSKAFTESCLEPTGKAFGKAFAMPSVKAMPNQEQEQEQEQKKNIVASPKSKRIPSGDHQLFIAWWDMAFYKVFEQKPRIDGKSVKLVKGMLSGVESVKQLVCYASVVLTEDSKFYDEAGRTLGVLSSQLEAFKSRKNHYDVALWRKYGIAPPEDIKFEDWKFWEQSDD